MYFGMNVSKKIRQLFTISALVYASIPRPVYGLDVAKSIKNFFISEYESLSDVKDAPDFIKKVSPSVFLFEGGTGSFVKYADELFIMTNNHVLGFKHCSRKGCFAKAVFNFEKGKKKNEALLFVTPVAASDDVDVSFFRFQRVKNDGTFVSVKPNNFLNFAKKSANIGSVVYPVGHPRTSIKKYSSGKLVKFENGYMLVNALTLPGNSGSPILNEKGEIVGIHHSSVKRNDGFTRNGLLYIGRASKTSDLIEVLQSGLLDSETELSKFWNVDARAKLIHAKRFTAIYKKSKTIPILDKGGDFFDALYDDCSKNLDLNTNRIVKFSRSHDSCTVALSWISCSKEKSPVGFILATTLNDSIPEFDGYESYCPQGKKKQKWAKLFKSIGQRYQTFRGKDPQVWSIDAISKLISNEQKTSKIAMKYLLDSYGKNGSQLSITQIQRISRYSDALGKNSKFGLVDLSEYVKEYQKIPNYEYELFRLAQISKKLHENGHLTIDELNDILGSIMDETRLSLNAKLGVEKIAFNYGLL